MSGTMASRIDFANVLIFSGLISIAVGLILIFTLRSLDRSARYWITAALVSGLATLLRTTISSSDHFVAVSIPNALNLLINFLFLYSLRAVLGLRSRMDQLAWVMIPLTVAYALLHEFIFGAGSAFIEIIVNPIIQITMALSIGYISYRIFREKGLKFAAIITFLQIVLALLWVARLFTAVSQGRIDFETLSVINAFIFTPLLLTGTLRLLCYLGLRLEQYGNEIDKTSAVGLLNTLGALAAARDNPGTNHQLRVSKYVRVLAEHLDALGNLDHQGIRNYMQLLYDVTPLHDIGKVGVPDQILNKTTRLDPMEWQIMRSHASIGANLIEAARLPTISRDSALSEVLRVGRQIALSHHENWNGTGYPSGLRGRDIPQAAHLVALADAYDALRTKRVYKEAFDHDRAVADIVSKKGTRFDPELVAAFVSEAERFREIADTYRD